jgi:hypothetical protein
LVVSVKKDSIVLDTETIPVIEDYGTEATESKYTLNLVNDVLTIEADYTGKALNLPLRTSAVLYKGTTQASGVTYEILSSPGVECEIDSSGQIEITGVDQDTDKFSIPIRVTLDNTSVVGILSLQKSTSLLPESQKPGTLVISSDPSGLEVLAEYKSSPSGTLSEYAYTNTGSQEYLYLYTKELQGIALYSIRWASETEEVENLVPADSDTIPSLEIYYIPYSLSNLLTTSEITSFKSTRAAYYVTNDITVRRGNLVKASVNIKAEVYQNISIDSKVSEILEEYAYQFGVDLESKKSEIIALLSKIPNVKQITSLEITYTNELADVIPWETVQESLETTYFSITYLVNSIIYTS